MLIQNQDEQHLIPGDNQLTNGVSFYISASNGHNPSLFGDF